MGLKQFNNSSTNTIFAYDLSTFYYNQPHRFSILKHNKIRQFKFYDACDTNFNEPAYISTQELVIIPFHPTQIKFDYQTARVYVSSLEEKFTKNSPFAWNKLPYICHNFSSHSIE